MKKTVFVFQDIEIDGVVAKARIGIGGDGFISITWQGHVAGFDYQDAETRMRGLSLIALRLQALEAFIEKLHDRLHPSILERWIQTRLDPDLQEELETLLKRKK